MKKLVLKILKALRSYLAYAKASFFRGWALLLDSVHEDPSIAITINIVVIILDFDEVRQANNLGAMAILERTFPSFIIHS